MSGDAVKRGRPADWPWSNWLVLLAMVVVFVIGQSASPATDRFLLSSRNPQLHQFVTYAFFHLSWAHLAGNMIALFVFGGLVNRRIGNVGYITFFLSGAVIAGIGFLLRPTGAQVMGASGAAGAVMGAALALCPWARLTIRNPWRPGRPLRLALLSVVVAYFAFNVLMSFTSTTGVAYITHLAGMIFGWLVGLPLKWILAD